MLRSLSVISFITLLSSAFPFLLLPIITRWVTVVDYGNLIVLETFLAIVTPFIQFSIAGVVVEYFKLSKQDFSGYVTMAFALSLPAFIGLELLVWLIGDSIAARFAVDTDWLYILPVYVLFNMSFQILALIYQCNKNYKGYALMLLGPSLTSFCLTLLFLIGFDWGWQAKLYGTGLSFALFATIAFWVLYREGYLCRIFSKRLIGLNLDFTLPVVPHTVAAGLYFVADRLFLSDMMGNSSVALYAAGMQLAMIMSVVQNALSRAWNPHVLGYLGECEKANGSFYQAYRALAKQMFYACLMVLMMSIGLAVVIYFTVEYLLPAHYESSKYLGVMLVSAFCLLGFYKVVSPILWHHKRSASLSKVTIAVFLINMLLNALMIPAFGVNGACYATIISMGCQFVFTLILVWRVSSTHLREVAQSV